MDWGGAAMQAAFVAIFMRSTSNPVFRFLIVLLLGTLVIVGGCARQKPAGRTVASTTTAPAQAADRRTKPQEPAKPKKNVEAENLIGVQKDIDLKWTDTKTGQVKMQVKASGGEVNGKDKVAVLHNISAKLYENGKITAEMTAPKAHLDIDKRQVIATGGVMMKSLERRPSFVRRGCGGTKRRTWSLVVAE